MQRGVLFSQRFLLLHALLVLPLLKGPSNAHHLNTDCHNPSLRGSLAYRASPDLAPAGATGSGSDSSSLGSANTHRARGNGNGTPHW